jgi:hypothetical protein
MQCTAVYRAEETLVGKRKGPLESYDRGAVALRRSCLRCGVEVIVEIECVQFAVGWPEAV